MHKLIRCVTRCMCEHACVCVHTAVSIRAQDDSLRGIYSENVNEFLSKSIFEEPYVSVEEKKEEKKTESRCLTG